MATRRGSSEIPRVLKGDWRRLAEAMRQLEWTFELGGRHVKAFAPDGVTIIVLPTTPSDKRAFPNARAAFRRWCRAAGITPPI